MDCRHHVYQIHHKVWLYLHEVDCCQTTRWKGVLILWSWLSRLELKRYWRYVSRKRSGKNATFLNYVAIFIHYFSSNLHKVCNYPIKSQRSPVRRRKLPTKTQPDKTTTSVSWNSRSITISAEERPKLRIHLQKCIRMCQLHAIWRNSHVMWWYIEDCTWSLEQ